MPITANTFRTKFNATFFPHSLKTKLTISTLFFFLVGIWSMAFFSGYTLHKDMEHDLGTQQFSSISAIASGINSELEHRLSSTGKVAALITPAMVVNAAHMQRFLEDRPDLTMLFNSGIFVIRLDDGVAIAEVPKSTGRIGKNYGDRKFVVKTMEGKAFIDLPIMGRTLKAPVIPIVAPIKDSSGKVIGALVGSLNLGLPNFISRMIDNAYGKTGGYLLVSRQSKTIVYATDKKRIMEKLEGPNINPLIERFLQGYEGTGIDVNPVGVEVLASAKDIPLVGWNVAVMIPTKEAFAPIRVMQERMFLATILLTLLAGGMTWWILKRQLAPIFSTIKALTILSTADQVSKPLPIIKQDEIGALISGFNRLLESLQQREESMKKIAEQHRHILQTATDGFLLLDFQGHVKAVNVSYCRMSGYNEQELLAKSIYELETNETGSYTVEHTRQIGEDCFETRHRSKDGIVFDVEASVQYQPAEGGYFVVFLRDITERKKVENSLRESEAKYRALASTVDALVLVDRNCQIIFANENYLAGRGFVKGSFVGRKYDEFHDEETSKKFAEGIKWVFETGNVYQDEWLGKIRKKYWIRTFNPLKNNEGIITAVVVAMKDITERKHAEDALRESEANYHSLASVADRSFVADKECRYIFANDNYLNTFKLQKNEIIGKTFAELHSDEGTRLFTESFKHVLDTGETYHREYQSKITGRYFVQKLAPVYSSDGCISAVTVISTDITDRKEVEDKLSSSLKEKELLLREVHHRVKNNMQVISSLLSLEASASNSAEAVVACQDSQRRIQSMALIHEKLYRADNFNEIDLTDYARELAQVLINANALYPGKIDLTIDAKDVYTDINKAIPCGLVLNELISNAIKHAFINKSTGKILISIARANNNEIQIAVRDDGLGLPEDFDIQQSKRIGFYLVNGLVTNQLCGQWDLSGHHGTEVRFTFPA